MLKLSRDPGPRVRERFRDRRFSQGVLSIPAVAIAFVVGCGGSAERGAGQEFVAQANSVCAEFEAFSTDQEQLFREQLSSGDFDRAADTFEGYGRELERSVTEIADLDRPSDDRSSVETFIKSTRELTDLVPEVVDALRKSDTATLLSVGSRLQEVQQKADRAARESGLDRCAEAGPATGATA